MLLLLNRVKVCLQSICSQKQGNGRKSEEIGGFTSSKIKIHVIQAFHKKESKFSSFQSPLTRNNQVWIKNEEPNERSRAWMPAAIQPIGISSNRSAGPSGRIQPIGANPQPIGWLSRIESEEDVLLHST